MTDQLSPFNQHQFDRCMRWFAARHGELTQYQLVKLHVMTDVFHVLETGLPVIGGRFRRWKLGPVVPNGWHRTRQYVQQFEAGSRPPALSVRPTDGSAYRYSVPEDAETEEQEFSASEVRAMERAWAEVGELSWEESHRYFHTPESFMGKAWLEAPQNGPIPWELIVDCYDAATGEDHGHVKALMALGV
jgi:hypothetical protein